jgi:hypothetical protein
LTEAFQAACSNALVKAAPRSQVFMAPATGAQARVR